MSAIRTALVNADGLVVDVVMTDPTMSWKPPEGQTPYQLPDDSPVGPGWTRTGSTFTAPTEAPAAVPLPTVLDLQAQVDSLMDYVLSL